jgi:FkbM family methyltransferase
MPSRPRSKVRRSLRKLWRRLRYQYRVLLRPIVTIEGIRVRVGRHMSPRVERAISRGGYERDELRLIRMLLSPSDVVLDIGAGLGIVSAFCAKELGSGRVFAFEANPDLEPRIRETFALNGVDPTLEMSAVRATSGRVTLFCDKHVLTSFAVKPTDEARAIEVPGKALSYVVEKIRPTVLIIEVEAADGELFDRAQLPGVTKVVLELHEHVVGQAQTSRVRAALSALGFKEDFRLSSRVHLVLRR